MSVKCKTASSRYVESVIRLRNALSNLQEFADGLPAPDENDELPCLHYGQVACVSHVLAHVTDRFDG